MKEDGYWITDFHALFTDGALFRDGAWEELTTRVHQIGNLRVKEGWGLFAQDEDVEFETTFDHLPPAGNAQVSVAMSDERILALLLRFGSLPVVSWSPALYDGQQMNARAISADGGAQELSDFPRERGDPISTQSARRSPLRCASHDRVIALHIDDLDVRPWWGWDESGAIAVFELDTSGASLREHEQKDPTPEDRRWVKNSNRSVIPASLRAAPVRRRLGRVGRTFWSREPIERPLLRPLLRASTTTHAVSPLIARAEAHALAAMA